MKQYLDSIEETDISSIEMNEIKEYLKHIYIHGHEYLHDPLFKTSNWTFIVYPDSAPESWKDKLISMGMQIAISPLHDKDINEGTGAYKKPHYHCVACFSGPINWALATKRLKWLNGPVPLDVIDMNGITSYLCHLKNPEKHQYSVDEIEAYNRMDIDKWFQPTSSQMEHMLSEIISFLNEDTYAFSSFAEFMQFCINNKYEWFQLISKKYTLITVQVLKDVIKNRKID